ncbi:MAG: rRNA adenine N-6-methyltransferase family protein, partial [Acidilobaceae archaeon]
GVGSITLAVSEFSELIVAVEIHPRLASFLAELGLENVLVLRGDGVEVASSTLMEAVYSNTPYNISAPLILALARNNHVREAVLGVQLEVAERLLAKPGSESYGRLTAVTQRVFSVEKVGVIPSEYYFPEPEVHGAVVKLVRRKAWSREDDLVEAVARCLFTGRNKKVAKMVRRCFEIELEDLSLGEKRVRELSPEDLEKIALTIEL